MVDSQVGEEMGLKIIKSYTSSCKYCPRTHPLENGQKEENELTEFKTNLNLDFKSRFTSGIADQDSDSGEEENTLRDNSPILSDKDPADQPGNIRISQHMQT